MRSCRRELATNSNFDKAEGGISYPLLKSVPRTPNYQFLKTPLPTAGTHTGRAEVVLHYFPAKTFS